MPLDGDPYVGVIGSMCPALLSDTKFTWHLRKDILLTAHEKVTSASRGFCQEVLGSSGQAYLFSPSKQMLTNQWGYDQFTCRSGNTKAEKQEQAAEDLENKDTFQKTSKMPSHKDGTIS